MPTNNSELFWPAVYKFSIDLINSNQFINFMQTNRTVVSDSQIVNSLERGQNIYHTMSDSNNSTWDALNDNIQNIILPSSMSGVNNTMNCTDYFSEWRNSYASTLDILNRINYFIITVGILFNILNLIVLLNSKLNESPYTYLTILALSDLGALCMIGVNKLAGATNNAIFTFVHLYVVTPLINVFLGTSMYITLALTIERFIFVHSPFKAMLICRKSIARRVCCFIFIFSILRSIYLPFMYGTNSCLTNAFDQKKIKAIDIYEFLISLAIPYSIIFVANISLICSLSKQNSLMNVPLSPIFSNMSHFSFKSFQEYQTIAARSKNAENNNNRNATNSDRVMNGIELADQNRRSLAKSLSANSNAEHGCSVSSNSFRKKFKKSSRFSLNLEAIHSNGTSHHRERNESTRSSKSNSLYHRTSNQREMKNQRKLTTSLIIILCLLLVCYLPSFLFEESLADLIFGEHNSRTEESKRALKIKAIGHRISLILMYINCSANFLIYCISNKKFNNSLKYLVKRSSIYKFITDTCFKFKRKDSKTQFDSLTQYNYRNELQELMLTNPEAINKSRNQSFRSSFTTNNNNNNNNNQKPNENETNYFNRLKKWNRLSQASASRSPRSERLTPNGVDQDGKLIKYQNKDYIILDKSYTII